MPIRPDLRHFYRTPEWKAARAACRERAGDRCEQCGAPNHTIVLRCHGTTWIDPAIGQAHGTEVRHVLIQCGAAHLNNVAGDDRPENLAWLCRGCHLHRDAGFHRETRATRKDAARPLLAPQWSDLVGTAMRDADDFVEQSIAKGAV